MKSMDPTSWEDCRWWFEDTPEALAIMDKYETEIRVWAAEKQENLLVAIQSFVERAQHRELSRKKWEMDYISEKRSLILRIKEAEMKEREALRGKGLTQDVPSDGPSKYDEIKREIALEILQEGFGVGITIRCTELAPSEVLALRLKLESERTVSPSGV